MSVDSDGLRFDPPAIALEPGLAWVLARAFGSPDLQATAPDGPAAAALAERLALAPRIAARQPADRLIREVGETPAKSLHRSRSQAIAWEMRLHAALAAFDATAASAETPYAPLKGQALVLGGFALAGARPSTDLDLLVPAARLDDLQRRLRNRGFDEVGEGYEHQAPALRHGGGGLVELHRVVLGVRLAGRRSAGFDELEAAGLLAPLVPELDRAPARDPRSKPADRRLASRELLAAHALVHALAQHGFAPRAYPGLLLVADLVDLGFGGSQGLALARLLSWIEPAVGREEAEAAFELAAALVSGDLSALGDGGGRRPRARRLLDHFIGGALDPGYAESLKTRALESPLSDRPRSWARGALVARALWPARRGAVGGARESIRSYAGRLLARPFDLLRKWRAARKAARIGPS